LIHYDANCKWQAVCAEHFLYCTRTALCHDRFTAAAAAQRVAQHQQQQQQQQETQTVSLSLTVLMMETSTCRRVLLMVSTVLQ
jgi:hypothetical protein